VTQSAGGPAHSTTLREPVAVRPCAVASREHAPRTRLANTLAPPPGSRPPCVMNRLASRLSTYSVGAAPPWRLGDAGNSAAPALHSAMSRSSSLTRHEYQRLNDPVLSDALVVVGSARRFQSHGWTPPAPRIGAAWYADLADPPGRRPCFDCPGAGARESRQPSTYYYEKGDDSLPGNPAW